MPRKRAKTAAHVLCTVKYFQLFAFILGNFCKLNTIYVLQFLGSKYRPIMTLFFSLLYTLLS